MQIFEDVLLLWRYLCREPPAVLCMCEKQSGGKLLTHFSGLNPHVMSESGYNVTSLEQWVPPPLTQQDPQEPWSLISFSVGHSGHCCLESNSAGSFRPPAYWTLQRLDRWVLLWATYLKHGRFDAGDYTASENTAYKQKYIVYIIGECTEQQILTLTNMRAMEY